MPQKHENDPLFVCVTIIRPENLPQNLYYLQLLTITQINDIMHVLSF